jgi:hypothetical protein
MMDEQEQRLGNTLGPAKRVIFADPPGFGKMELIFGSLKVRSCAENANDRCMFCSASHPRAIACAAAQRVHGDSWELEYYRLPEGGDAT